MPVDAPMLMTRQRAAQAGPHVCQLASEPLNGSAGVNRR